ncbi:MAG: hypothetical protein KDB00_13785 [Planctomycetales bacterium]|nr:hypothetical protein [Planctomycetales bacterium]
MSRNPGARVGYTMIELIGAMAASTVLLLALASSVAISTSLVQPTDEDGRQSRDQTIFDRLNHDLRYATAISFDNSYSFNVRRPDLSGGEQTLTYEAYYDGLTRQADGADAIQLDVSTPVISHAVDGYSAPTSFAQETRPRVRSVATAVTGGSPASSMTIDLPEGARSGDLLMLVAVYRNTFYAFPVTSGWHFQTFRFNTNIVLIVYYRIMDSSTPLSHSIVFENGGDVAASVLAIEKANNDAPFLWTGSAAGTSTVGSEDTFPQPLENSGATGVHSLSLQLFGASGSPNSPSSLGAASMCDCVNLVGSRWSGGECSLGVAFRTGPMPTLSNIPHVLHQQSAHWVTIGTEIGGTYE